MEEEEEEEKMKKKTTVRSVPDGSDNKSTQQVLIKVQDRKRQIQALTNNSGAVLKLLSVGI